MFALFLILILFCLLVACVLAQWRNAGEIRRGAKQFHSRGGAEGLTPVLMPVCGRPHYLRRVLDALANVDGIEKTIVVISQDGRDPEVSALIAEIRFTKVIILKHARPFGGIFCYFWDSLHAVSANIRFLLDFAFKEMGAGCAIVLEDDILPSPDFFRFFSWASRHVLSHETVLSVTGFNLHSRPSPEHGYDPRNYPYDMIENREDGKPKFTGWSWAITAPMWQRVRKHWSSLSWDIELDKTQRKLGLVSYKPVLGRVRNIGMQGGINFTEAEDNPKWTGMVVAEKGLSGDLLPRFLAADPVVPSFRDVPPSRPVPNERTRTRFRRLALCVIVAVLIGGDLFFFGWP